MKKFDLKKQRRRERRNDKALEEFSKSEEKERAATVTIGSRQVDGVIRKTGALSYVFEERIPAGTEREPIRITLSKPGNFFQYAESKATDEGFELTSSSEGEMTLDANTSSTSPDASAQADEREGLDEQE